MHLGPSAVPRPSIRLRYGAHSLLARRPRERVGHRPAARDAAARTESTDCRCCSARASVPSRHRHPRPGRALTSAGGPSRRQRARPEGYVVRSAACTPCAHPHATAHLTGSAEPWAVRTVAALGECGPGADDRAQPVRIERRARLVHDRARPASGRPTWRSVGRAVQRGVSTLCIL